MKTAHSRWWFLVPALLSIPAVAADAVSEWNQRAEACALEAKQDALFATRTLAIVHVLRII